MTPQSTALEPPVALTRSGRVQGRREGVVLAFRGIPYAAPPTGPRWLDLPAREARWDGLRPATEVAATAPQRVPRINPFPEVLVAGEEYLNVNVFTPNLGASALPVLVWIHGGAFIIGSPASPWYDPAAFVADGVVVVTI
ncbi:MAG: carboxylesterase family protein, partial [Mycobacteriales bacterium]